MGSGWGAGGLMADLNAARQLGAIADELERKQ
jgi:hypothetical protein